MTHESWFKDKVILVTGASRGIGYTVARNFCARGAQLVLADISDEATLQKAGDDMVAEGGLAPLCVRTDVSRESDVQNLMAVIKERFGALNVVVNNAGIAVDGFLMRYKVDDMDRMWRVNVQSALLVTKHAFPLLSRAENPSVIHMSSVVGIMGNPGQTVYSATKAALIGMTKSMAKEFAARGIRVNAIAPGFIETDMTKALAENIRAEYLNHIPLKRYGSPQDIAEACCFLASPAASYITGHVCVIDGGLSM